MRDASDAVYLITVLHQVWTSPGELDDESTDKSAIICMLELADLCEPDVIIAS